jgi:hypothetical protein
MAQAAFEFSPSTAADERAAEPLPGQRHATHGTRCLAAMPTAVPDPVGWEIGHDHARYRVTPPLRHLHDHNPVRQGWEHGHALFGARTLRPSAAVRQWLALRLQAWQHGQAFEGVQVTPHFLARIDNTACPVRRCTLTLAAERPDDATVTRLNPAAAYAAGNLAALSRQAAQALGEGGFATAWQRAQALADGTAAGHASPDPARPADGGLDATEWRRLAVLASFATPLPHAHAAALPLPVLPPNRVRVVNPVQALQVMLTLQFGQAGYARRLLGLAALMPGGEIRQAFQVFMHTLLARRLAAGAGADATTLRRAMEDSWGDALVNRRWQKLALRLTAADCEQLLQRAGQRGWVVGGVRWIGSEHATEGWALRDDTRAGARAGAGPVGRTAQAGSGSGAARPGSARSRGSQKLAS